MCLAQGPQRSDAGEAQTRGPSVLSQAFYHWATALPKQVLIFFKLFLWRLIQSLQTKQTLMKCHMMWHFIWVFTVCKSTRLRVSRKFRVYKGLNYTISFSKYGVILTHKVPPIICSRWQFQILLIFQKEQIRHDISWESSQTILMKYHILFFSKTKKDVTKFVVCCIRDWQL